jgi:hypothetical protein
MGRFSQFLIDLLPVTGRLIKEDGDTINQADFLAIKSLEEISTQSLLNNAYAATFRRTMPANESVDVVLEIPIGTRVYFHLREQVIEGGSLEWELRLRPDAGYVEAERIRGNNLNEELNLQSLASLVRTVNPTTGSVFRREGIIKPAGTGSNSTTETTSVADAIPQYVTGSEPVLRLNNTSNVSMLIIVTFIWAELPNV